MIITCACGTTFEKTGRGRPPVKCEKCRNSKFIKINTFNKPIKTPENILATYGKTYKAEDIIGDATHLVPKKIGVEIKRELTCEFGHTWMAPVQRGRPPRFCPEHINKAPRISERTTTTKHQGELLRKILEASAAASCLCGITPETTPAELRAIGDKSCTHPHHICSILDACRRAMGM